MAIGLVYPTEKIVKDILETERSPSYKHGCTERDVRDVS